MVSNMKLKQWQKELDRMTETTGISLVDVCEYLGISYNRDIGFYVKIPMKRRTMIGIGMAFYQPLSEINRWISEYGHKRRLYSKDISEDLIWIFLINRNYAEKNPDINYFRMYEDCRQTAYETYLTIWNDLICDPQDTSDVDDRLSRLGGGNCMQDLKDFVISNIDSFKTAYAKPRRMLAAYVDNILRTNGRSSSGGESDALISLRGWLDDSMINYLSGSPETINVIDNKTGTRKPGIKSVPKSRTSHISLALALGMTADEISRYLEMMGFEPLDEQLPDDKMLIRELEIWEAEHPLQREYKEKYIQGNDAAVMSDEDESQAVSDMLMLRQDLRARYRKKRQKFVYMK